MGDARDAPDREQARELPEGATRIWAPTGAPARGPACTLLAARATWRDALPSLPPPALTAPRSLRARRPLGSARSKCSSLDIGRWAHHRRSTDTGTAHRTLQAPSWLAWVEPARTAAHAPSVRAARSPRVADAPPVHLPCCSNVGWFTVTAAALGYSVVSFEATTPNAFAIRRSLCTNPQLQRRVALVNKVRGGATGRSCWLLCLARPLHAHLARAASQRVSRACALPRRCRDRLLRCRPAAGLERQD